MNTFLKYLIEKAWPWFMKYIWPLLKEHVMELITRILKRCFEYLRERTDATFDSRVKKAEKEAETADLKASQSSDKAETEKQRAIAEVWRQVAEQYRQDLKQMESELKRASEQAHQESVETVEKIDPKLSSGKADNPLLSLSGQSLTLPKLDQHQAP